MTGPSLLRQVSAEFLGTFTLIAFGVAVNAQVTFSGGSAGDFFTINAGWGVAVMLAVYMAGGVSGAHLNPAVTLALFLRRGFPGARVLPYIFAQVAGAFVASALIYAVYFDALNAYEVELRGPREATHQTHAIETAGVFATYPSPHLSPIRGGLVDQIAGTAMLLLCICALIDTKNLAPNPTVAPVMIGLIVFAIGMGFGYNCGYAVNPAHDFGPRLFTYVAGWGSGVFNANDQFWWVPIVGPLIGGVIGVLVYDLFILWQYPADDDN